MMVMKLNRNSIDLMLNFRGRKTYTKIVRIKFMTNGKGKKPKHTCILKDGTATQKTEGHERERG